MQRRIHTVALPVIFALAALAGCAPSGDGHAPLPDVGDLAGYPVRPVSQAVELRIDPDAAGYSGTVRIELAVLETTDRFGFHAEQIEFRGIELASAAGETVELELENGAHGLVTASAATPLEPGAYTLIVDFENGYDDRAVGLYKYTDENDGAGYLFTQFQAVDARKAFPCWDEPAFKIPYQLTLNVPNGTEAMTNTPLEEETTIADGRRLVFAQTPPLPSYLLAIAAGPLEHVEIPGMSIPGRIYTVKGRTALAAAAVETTPRILAAMEHYFDGGYPFAKLDLIAVPEFWPGAMENPGAVTFAEGVLLQDSTTASASQQRRLAAVVAHELAHMWFGDLVTMYWWDDLWLNEAFASWLGDKITHEVYPEYRMDVTGVGSVQSVMSADARPSTRAIRKPVNEPSDIMEGIGLTYAKGQAVLEMVEHWIGAEKFRTGVQRYLGDHEWGSASADALWSALGKASREDVGRVMTGFLDQPGCALVTVEPSGSEVTLSQSRFSSHGVDVDPQSWTIPVNLRYAVAGEVHEVATLLEGDRVTVALAGEPDWLLPNAGVTGYYRWVLPADGLRSLAAAAAETLDTRERVAFLGNAGALLDAGILGGGDYLQILNAFAGDADPEVVSAVVTSLDKVRSSFVPDELTGAFAVYVRNTLGPALERFGLEPKTNEAESVSLFRPRLFSYLGDEGADSKVRVFAGNLAERYIAGEPVDPTLARIALRISARGGDGRRYATYRDAFTEAQDPSRRGAFLAALAAFEDAGLQRRALQFALEGPVRPTETFTVLQGLPPTEASAQHAYEWMKSNHDRITERIPPDFVGFMPMFAGGCSDERLADAHEFFGAEERSNPGVQGMLGRISDQVGACVSLRAREGEGVAAYLEQLGAGRG